MSNTAKWLRIQVTDLTTGESKANVRIPKSLANFGLKMAAKYAPDSIEGLDMDQIMSAIQEGGENKFVDVEDIQKGEHVEIFVE